ncbi:protein preY, mitochondrial-like [Ruditapes philippinarum]|uniref:protein preY, mitochondrial-like n=1 Tax=Ruditapes philippinarum TaxID=129788 RepID=UPI00295B89CE|nr:protein preY, mitochondrial-like [Ruditapes philippinarum]
MALPMKTFLSYLIRVSWRQETKSLPCLFQQSDFSIIKQNQNLFCSKTDQPNDSTNSQQFDETLLQVLVCPISKKPLRYDKETSELVSDSIGVAYPIKNGVPNLVPQDARMLETPSET